jgi:hypothetical protein
MEEQRKVGSGSTQGLFHVQLYKRESGVGRVFSFQ